MIQTLDKLPEFPRLLPILITLQLLHVATEQLFFNGTHSVRKNHTIEVTTVKIAEIVNLKVNNNTIFLKEKTAKHFVNPTPNSKIALVPTSKIDARIEHHSKNMISRPIA